MQLMELIKEIRAQNCILLAMAIAQNPEIAEVVTKKVEELVQ